MSFYKIRPRSGTKAQWETANTILAEREIGYELPDGGVGTGVVKMKMGDGVTAWNELPYASYVPDVPNDKGLTEVWNSETSYLANDYVIYDNKVWQALISNNGQTPAEGTYWTQVSLKGLNEKYTELNNSLTNVIFLDGNPISFGADERWKLKIIRQSFISDANGMGLIYIGDKLASMSDTILLGVEPYSNSYAVIETFINSSSNYRLLVKNTNGTIITNTQIGYTMFCLTTL